MKHKPTCASFAFVLAVVVFGGGSARAAGCGDVVAGPGSERLETDLACAAPVALTVRDGATLDLGGRTVTCTAGGVGVALEGAGARLLDGVVTGCDTGVALSGRSHLVRNVRATFNGRGFVTGGALDDTRLEDNGADFNAAGGVHVLGDRNVIRRTVAFGNGDTALFVVGVGNTVTRNETMGNCLPGGCAAAVVVAGGGNAVTRNTATGEQTAFLLASGFGTGTSGNTLVKNTALFSGLAGIVVADGAVDNRLRRNAVRGGAVHLVDFNADCGTNVWERNSFRTGNQPCIR
jgi:hypothetical protein